MGKSKKQKESERLLVEQQRQSLNQQEFSFEQAKEALAFQKDLFKTIEPLINMLVGFGIDPVAFLASEQGQAILSPIQQTIAGNFEGARQNLVDLLGSSGFSTQSGVGVGPFANLLSQEAQAQSNAVQDLVGQSLNLGLQGGNILTGQQAVFDPTRIGGLGVQQGQLGTQSAGTLFSAPAGFGQQLGLAALGAGGTALSGFLGRPQFSSGGGTTTPTVPSGPGTPFPWGI